MEESKMMDKILKYSVIGLFAVMGVLIIVYFTMAGGVSDRVHEKSARVLAGVNVVLAQGGDPTAALDHLGQVKPLLAAHDVAGAEAALDKALTALGPAGAIDPATIKPTELPVYDATEPSAALFGAPVKVQIIGYYGNAMEPFVSADGEYLFFNSENNPQYDTNILYAKKKDDRGFIYEYIGAVPGAFSAEMDSAPSLDESGRFFFTSLRSYNKSLLSLYAGRFSTEGVTGIKAVEGDLSAPKLGTINSDAEVSRDGTAIYFTRSQFLFGQAVPLSSDLAVAYFIDGGFLPQPVDTIMQAVNTPALEYGPSLTADGMELYFTRASSSGARIMVASRPAVDQPFSTAYVISTISGNVGGPFITSEGSTLYFHSAEGKGYTIYRAERSN
jgi:hypothetical protein